MKLKVKVTKEILRKSMYCALHEATSNCAIALAIREIFPNADVENDWYSPFGCEIDADHNGSDFIQKFDSRNPQQRLELPETEVELEITDEILNELNKNVNWQEIINQSELLELI